MRLCITGSQNITQFNPVLYFQLKEPNFRRFCIENGFLTCKVSEIITTSSDGVDTSARDWAGLLGFNLQTFSPDDDSAAALLKCQKEVIADSDLMLIIQNQQSTQFDELLTYAKQLNKPVFLIYEFSNL